jgi:tryptophan-rich sensory protein
MMAALAEHWMAITVAVAGTLVVAGVGGWLTETGPWYRSLTFPSWKPPDWSFGPIWTTILTLATISMVLAWTAAPTPAARSLVVGLFVANGALNVGWNLLFFTMRRPDLALVEVVFLWLSVLALLVGLAPFSALAALLLVPYLVWVGIAAFLNLRIVRLNAPFTGAGARSHGTIGR